MITVKISIWIQAHNAVELLFGFTEDVKGFGVVFWFFFSFPRGYEESA